MKLKKKALISLSVAVGVAVLATTALVGAVNESAYTQLKNAVKTTSAKVAAEDGNFTQNTVVTLMDNGVVLLRTTSSSKAAGSANEQSSVTETKGGTTQTTYSFYNASKNIYYDSYSDTYFVNEWTSPMVGASDSSGAPLLDAKGYAVDSATNYDTQDPLAQENVKDLERILDAFVGNLKDYVSVTENADGSRTFTGSLSDTQIPALINAIASFATKQYLTSNGMAQPMTAVDSTGVMIEGKTDPDGVVYPNATENRYGLPSLTGDIFVKSVSGTATTDADGVLTGGDLAVVLSGTDADGVAHDLSLRIQASMTGIGTTVVTEPDLTGKKVQITKNDPGVVQDKLTAEFVGTYRNDIVTKIDGAFAKIGERTIVIESITADTVKGSYTETFNDGVEGYVPLTFTFEAPNSGYFNINFTYTDANGTLIGGNMYFDATNASIQFQPMDSKGVTNSTFPRVFD